MTYLSHIKEPNPQTMPNGEQHGLVKVLGNSVPFNDYKRFAEKDREKMKSIHKEQSKMVKAMCINTVDSTRRLPMTYSKWDGDPLLGYRLIPDQEYEVPKGVVDEINNKKVNKRSGILDPKTNQPTLLDQMVPGEWRMVPVGF